MRRYLYCVLLLVTTDCFSQVTDPSLQTAEDYYIKSRREKTWGYILSGLGVGLMVGGIAYDVDPNSTPSGVYIAGGALIAGGAALYLISRNTKKKSGQSATTLLKMQRLELPQDARFLKRSFPVLAIRVSIP